MNDLSKQMSSDLKGLNQLSKEGVLGVVDVVEAMHQRIFSMGGILNQGDINKTSGLTGLIYQVIRKTAHFSSKGINLALAKFSPLLPTPSNQQFRQQWVSILNGVLGDHLVESQNPLAIEMTLVYQGKTVTPQQAAEICANQPGNPLLLIHGLCMNDYLWRREQHDHGHALHESLGLTPVYLRYNSGLPVYQNGQQLAGILTDFINALPKHKSAQLLCHSMGGLVMRSAMHVAELQTANWLNELGKVVFLGTPHQGAVLEKAGQKLDYVISISSYSAPLVKMTQSRSQGIKDLSHGYVSKDHKMVPIPDQIKSYAIAGSTQEQANDGHHKIVGDGLVSVPSALGHHIKGHKLLNILPANQFIIQNVGHMGLLSSHQVFKQLQLIYND